MALFLGYDPGGYTGDGSNGVVSVSVSGDGLPKLLCGETVHGATQAFTWLKAQSEKEGRAAGLGIDTLLAWSEAGRRNLDDELRSDYKGSSVQSQNSLFSAMTINGILVATRVSQELGVPLVESHPKLLITARGGHLCREQDKSRGRIVRAKAGKLLKELDACQAVVDVYNQLLGDGKEHQADAFVAAWCASCWYGVPREWSTDLYDGSLDLVFPTLSLSGCGPLSGTAHLRDRERLAYPWPEELRSRRG